MSGSEYSDSELQDEQELLKELMQKFLEEKTEIGTNSEDSQDKMSSSESDEIKTQSQLQDLQDKMPSSESDEIRKLIESMDSQPSEETTSEETITEQNFGTLLFPAINEDEERSEIPTPSPEIPINPRRSRIPQYQKLQKKMKVTDLKISSYKYKNDITGALKNNNVIDVSVIRGNRTQTVERSSTLTVEKETQEEFDQRSTMCHRSYENVVYSNRLYDIGYDLEVVGGIRHTRKSLPSFLMSGILFSACVNAQWTFIGGMNFNLIAAECTKLKGDTCLGIGIDIEANYVDKSHILYHILEGTFIDSWGAEKIIEPNPNLESPKAAPEKAASQDNSPQTYEVPIQQDMLNIVNHDYEDMDDYEDIDDDDYEDMSNSISPQVTIVSADLNQTLSPVPGENTEESSSLLKSLEVLEKTLDKFPGKSATL